MLCTEAGHAPSPVLHGLGTVLFPVPCRAPSVTRAWAWSFLEPVPEDSVHSAQAKAMRQISWGLWSSPQLNSSGRSAHFHTNQLVQIMQGSNPHPPDRPLQGDTAQDPTSSKVSGHSRDTNLLAGGDVSYCFLSAPHTVWWV